MNVQLNKTISILIKDVLKFREINPYNFLDIGSLANSLLFFKVGKYLNNDEYLDLAFKEFEKVYDQVENVDVKTNLSLISGYSGLAWLFQYFVNNDLLEYDKDFFIFFDEIILKFCEEIAEKDNYDLFYGILGYGSYFLQRSKFDKKHSDYYLNSIVSILSNKAIHDANGVVWFSDIFSDVKGKINLGMAHGIPSIISFLTKVYLINGNPLAKELAEKSIKWLLNLKNLNPSSITLFPYFADFNIKKNIQLERNHANTRLAWCYGDLGIGYSIYVSGVVFENKFFIDEGLFILRKCAKRKADSEAVRIEDKGFCHGTAGCFYIFNKLVIKYGLIEFLEISTYWFEKTIKNPSEKIDSFYVYSYFEGKEKYAPDPGLINGYVGMLLSVLSKVENHSNEWDEIFML